MIRRIRRRGSRLARSEHGAVTIYTIVVIVPIFIFQAVLIDFVRIKVATMEAEQAIRAATRSVLSAYDKQLLDYGLFGLKASAEEQKMIANNVLSKYGTDGAQSDTFNWVVLNTLKDQTTAVPMYTLGDHRFFNQQILEDMKYKAPIEFSRNLYDKWKGKKDIVTDTEKEMQDADGLDKWLDKREKSLEDAFDHVEHMIRRMNQAYTSYTPKAIYIYESNTVVYDYSDVLRKARSDYNYIQGQYQSMHKYVQEAEQFEQQMEQQWDQEGKGELSEVYILGHPFYSNYDIGAATAISSLGAFINRVAAASATDSSAANTQQLSNSFQAWFSHRSNEESKRVAAFENLKRKKKEQRKKIKDQLDQSKQTANSQLCSNVNADPYTNLKSYYQSYLALNNNLNEQEYSSGTSMDQTADEYQLSAISFLSRLANIMENIRDETYVNEYTMYYFNHRTSSMQNPTSPLQDKLDKHALQDQEVEYILYGMSSCTANRVAAYSEMYALRFAIRTLEALTDARKAAAGSPLLIVLIAAAEGATKAYQDMERITNGEDVPVFAKWGNLTMNYADYLRMFLTVHSQEVKKLSRIQALIQLNTQIDLQQRPAYVQLKSIMTMRLWFIRGKLYQIKKTAEMSY